MITSHHCRLQTVPSQNRCTISTSSIKARNKPAVPRLLCKASNNTDDDGAVPSFAADLNAHCVIIECDGGLMDTHMDGHRIAFNKAFENIGYTCVNWQPPVYQDLLRLGDGTGPGLIKTYYEMVGWPMMLPTKDRRAFVEKVYNSKQEIFKDMVTKGEIPLRDGVIRFIDDLIADDVRPVVLTGTASAPEDSVVSSAMLNLGPARASKIQIISLGGASSDETGEEEDDDGGAEIGESIEKQLKAAQEKAKKITAASFVRAINLQNRGVGMQLDPALVAAAGRADLISPQYLVAIIMAMGSSAKNSALVAASHSLMKAGKASGLFIAAVPPSLAARGGYEAMDASFDGFGAGALTWTKLKAMLQSKNAKNP